MSNAFKLFKAKIPTYCLVSLHEQACNNFEVNLSKRWSSDQIMPI